MGGIGAMLYEGKAKKIFATARPDQVMQYFKDDATAFNAQKRGTILQKGVINNKVSERLFNDYVSGELNYLPWKHVLPLEALVCLLRPYHQLMRCLTFPSLGPL